MTLRDKPLNPASGGNASHEGGTMPHEFERVYTVTDYYDGPREGIADFRGVPHRYRSVYLDTATWDPDEDRFELTPVPPRLLALELEDWAIWCRWERAFYAGQVDASTHPALPEDRLRHEAIVGALAQESGAGHAPRLVARGEFRVVDPIPDLPNGVLRRLEVCWRPVDPGAHEV